MPAALSASLKSFFRLPVSVMKTSGTPGSLRAEKSGARFSTARRCHRHYPSNGLATVLPPRYHLLAAVALLVDGISVANHNAHLGPGTALGDQPAPGPGPCPTRPDQGAISTEPVLLPIMFTRRWTPELDAVHEGSCTASSYRRSISPAGGDTRINV